MVGITIHTMEYPNIPSYGALAQQEVIRISQTDRTCDHHEKGGQKGYPHGSNPGSRDLMSETTGRHETTRSIFPYLSVFRSATGVFRHLGS